MIAGLAVAAGALVFLGHEQSANLSWMGLVRRRGLGRADVADPGGRRCGRGPCPGPGRRVAHGHRRARMGRLVRRHLVHDRLDDLRPSAAARHDAAEGSTGRAGRAVPRRGAQPDRRRGARRHRPRAHGVPAAHQRRAARPGRGPAGGTSFAPGGRAADPGQPRGGARHRRPDAHRLPGRSGSAAGRGRPPRAGRVVPSRRLRRAARRRRAPRRARSHPRAGGVPDRAGGTHQRHQARARPTGAWCRSARPRTGRR